MPNYQEAYVSLVRAVEEVLKRWDAWQTPGPWSRTTKPHPESDFRNALVSLRRELPNTGAGEGR